MVITGCSVGGLLQKVVWYVVRQGEWCGQSNLAGLGGKRGERKRGGESGVDGVLSDMQAQVWDER